MELLVEKKASKLLGINWEEPLMDQAPKLVNRALYYIGADKVKQQLEAMEKTHKRITESRAKLIAQKSV